jgi:16S rRNA G966 N2-methylase RsmD
MKEHPLSGIFPMMSDDEFARLREDIALRGLLEPIWMCDGEILDGRHRFMACEKEGITPTFHEYTGDDPLGFVIAMNLKRRHLNESQRAMVGAQIANMPQGRPDKAANLPVSQEQAATLVNVSERSVRDATKVEEKATPELAQAVRDGEVSVSQAAKLAEEDPSLQMAVSAKVAGKKKSGPAAEKEARAESKAKRKSATPEAIPDPEGRYRLFCKAVSDVTSEDVPDASIDWVITDPPYPKKFLPVYRELSSFAARVLKPGGGLVCMVGQSYLPEVMEALAEHLRYHWALSYLTPGGQSVQLFRRKVNTFWKPVLWFQNGPYAGDWVGDVARSNVNDNDKQHHEWGQSESGMEDLVDRFTYPGQTICDPFLGAGTTGVVAVRNGRLFVGSDLDKEAVKVAAARLKEVGGCQR